MKLSFGLNGRLFKIFLFISHIKRKFCSSHFLPYFNIKTFFRFNILKIYNQTPDDNFTSWFVLANTIFYEFLSCLQIVHLVSVFSLYNYVSAGSWIMCRYGCGSQFSRSLRHLAGLGVRHQSLLSGDTVMVT